MGAMYVGGGGGTNIGGRYNGWVRGRYVGGWSVA